MTGNGPEFVTEDQLWYPEVHRSSRYRRTNRSSRRRRYLLALTPALAMLLIAGLGWRVVDGLRLPTTGCEPDCGVRPSPPTAPRDQDFSGTGWRVAYSEDVDGVPTVNQADQVQWTYSFLVGDSHDPSDFHVGFVGTKQGATAQELCDRTVAEMAKGYTLAYEFPNASLGSFLGVGAAYEKVKPAAGKQPERKGFFISCAQVGAVSVAGWAAGQRDLGSLFNGGFADPAHSPAAELLAEFSPRVQFLDKDGNAF